MVLVLIVLIPIGMKFWPKVTGKFPDMKWLKAKMLITFAIGIIIALTVREFWRQEWSSFHANHGWYFWLVLIGGIVLFCYVFGRSGESKSHGTPKHAAGSHEDHGGGLGILGGFTLLGVVLFLVVSLLQAARTVQGMQGGAPVAVSTPPSGTFVIPVSSATWTPVQVPFAMDMAWYNEKAILVQLQPDPPFEDDGKTAVKFQAKTGPYNALFKAKEGTAEVKIVLTPKR